MKKKYWAMIACIIDLILLVFFTTDLVESVTASPISFADITIDVLFELVVIWMIWDDGRDVVKLMGGEKDEK